MVLPLNKCFVVLEQMLQLLDTCNAAKLASVVAKSMIRVEGILLALVEHGHLANFFVNG